MESFVLAHVCRVWCNQIHFARAELACGVRGKNQKQELRIRMGQRANQIHDLASRFAMQSDIAFAIGESARFDAADIAAICLREATGEMFVAWKGKGEPLHAVVSFLIGCPGSLIELGCLVGVSTPHEQSVPCRRITTGRPMWRRGRNRPASEFPSYSDRSVDRDFVLSPEFACAVVAGYRDAPIALGNRDAVADIRHE